MFLIFMLCEIEFAGRPGVLVAAAGAAMIVGGDDQPVFALRLDHAPRHLGDQLDRIVPGGRRRAAIAPDQRFGQPLALRAGDRRIGELADLARRAWSRARSSRSQSWSGMTTRCTSRPFCLTMLYIDGLNQCGRHSAPAAWSGSTPKAFCAGLRAALPVDRPGEGVIAAADDAEVADDVVDLRVLRRDRQAVDVALVRPWHASLSLQARWRDGRRSAHRPTTA